MKKLFIIPIVLLNLVCFGQDSLSYEACVGIALKNNYDILIAVDNQEIASNSATVGNAGLLPTVTLDGGVNGSINNVTQQFITETDDTKFTGAKSTSQNARLGITYNIYQGNTRLNRLKNLRIQSKWSELQTKSTVEETMVLVGNFFFQLVGFQENLHLQQDILDVSNERFQRVSYQYEFGNALKIDVLNAEVNLNSDSLRFLQAKNNLFKAQQNLLVAMGSNDSLSVVVDNDISFLTDLDKQTLKSELETQNTYLLLADNKITQSQLNASIASGQMAPVIGSNLSYGINNQQSETGIVSSNLSHGLNAGITLSFDLYDGNKKRIAKQNAIIQTKISEKERDNTSLTLNKDLENSWYEYSYQMSVIRLQKRNIATNKANFDRSTELFQFGQITSTQYREAQINYLQSRFDFILSHTVAKIEELKLLQLSGRLIE